MKRLILAAAVAAAFASTAFAAPPQEQTTIYEVPLDGVIWPNGWGVGEHDIWLQLLFVTTPHEYGTFDSSQVSMHSAPDGGAPFALSNDFTVTTRYGEPGDAGMIQMYGEAGGITFAGNHAERWGYTDPALGLQLLGYAGWYVAFAENQPLPIAAVPEPETYALMLAGLGVLGARQLRKRKGHAIR